MNRVSKAINKFVSSKLEGIADDSFINEGDTRTVHIISIEVFGIRKQLAVKIRSVVNSQSEMPEDLGSMILSEHIITT